ncbi:MAG: hypothetical protein L6R41_002670 [Letrouitia leprolyta]|nr:MAG: hypothetical protein L6R41_002670 [Letrouitia leprolyta]
MKVPAYFIFLALPFSFAGTIRERQTELQQIPTTAKAPNTFHQDGIDLERGQPPQVDTPLPEQYRAKDIDIPFGRILKGSAKYFQAGEMNTPNGIIDEDGKVGQADYANQSACGIPDNVYRDSKVAIHPYWLKYAGLDRMCLQDVCIGIFTMTDDMIAKVTDICSIDPNDPSHCATPEDIKLPRKKIQTIYHYKGKTEDVPELKGAQHPQPIYWSFAKCLGEAIPQPPYKGPSTKNWFSTPPYPANNADAVQVALKQASNNQKSYPAKKWPTYEQGVTPGKDRLAALHKPVTDWKEGDSVPAWEPVAGGRGFGVVGAGKSGGGGRGNGTVRVVK